MEFIYLLQINSNSMIKPKIIKKKQLFIGEEGFSEGEIFSGGI